MARRTRTWHDGPVKSALALLAALVGLAGLVALGCTAPLAGAPCECLPGYECDRAADVCRPIRDAGPNDASSLLPTDAATGAIDAASDPPDAGGESIDARPFEPDSGIDGGGVTSDAA